MVAVTDRSVSRVAAPLRIGPLTVDPPVVLAPMAGVTNAAFRAICRSYGGGLLVSEMVNARGLLEGGNRSALLVAREPGSTRHSVQLYGTDPATVRKATRHLVEDLGVEHVDLNMGCPVSKVTRKGGGAALPARPVLFGAIVAAAVEGASGTGAPVTVKMRRGLDEDHLTALVAGRIAEEAGASAVALHARTALQLYSGRADWSAIAELKQSVTSIPVLGNGDVWCAEDALAMLVETGCDGVVVGRGCLGRPWLFRELEAAFAGRSVPPPPPLGEIADVMARHAESLCSLFGERAGILGFRKHVSWYLTGLPVGRGWRVGLVASETLADVTSQLDRMVAELGPALRVPADAAALPRGTTAGPRRVVVPEGWYDRADDPTPPLGADLDISGG